MKSLKLCLKRLLRSPLLIPLYAFWGSCTSKRLFRATANNGTVSALVFNAHRYGQDLEALESTGRITAYAFNSRVFYFINSLFKSPHYEEGKGYLEQKHPDVIASREQLTHYVNKFLPVLQKRLKFDCIITPAYHYFVENTWAAASHQAAIPFVAIHKENTLLDQSHVKRRGKNVKKRGVHFYGTKILCVNEAAKNIAIEAGVCKAEDIEVVGLPRTDRIVAGKFTTSKPKEKAVTLFSFGHYTGDFDPKEYPRAHYFSHHNDEGFVELFDEVHGCFAEAAIAEPSVHFYIKPKQISNKGWTDEIERAVKEATGKTIDEIPNLSLTGIDAPLLIEQSCLVIGLNSTVVMESRMIGKPTLLPLFAEAANKHKKALYFNGFHDLFEVSDSRADLYQRIMDRIHEKPTDQSQDNQLYQRFIATYLGFYDGKSSERVADSLNKLVN